MTVNDASIFIRAYSILKELYGEGAVFREGQYEAIEAAMTKRRTLVVQKTGWGKSLIYFICTKMMREDGKGLTLVVSPLLVLMQNQLEAADRMGLVCDVLNSTVKDRRPQILSDMKEGKTDLVFVTPETLFSEDVQRYINDIRIGLFVIDEAHCISDWGHDFRLEYGNLRRVISALPHNVPLLAVTATANDRVTADLEKQLGEDVYVSRGPLMRESLALQVLKMPSRTDRYAWILENIKKLYGSGIIYCLTQRDCDYLSDFLNKNGINARAYYSRDGEDGEKLNLEIEREFYNNEIKAVVATVKLGMGYDKGDVAFVIHYQMPMNIVSYYQQIGRAGRNLDIAYAFLMYGSEDDDIINYFIKTAFPTEKETDEIMKFIGDRGGAKLGEINANMNFRNARIQKALSFLVHDGYLIKDRSVYYVTPKIYKYDKEHYDSITAVRLEETKQMRALAETEDCLSEYIVRCLDDKTAKPCGKCANCLKRELFPSVPSEGYRKKAAEYLEKLILPIEPRKMWADGGRIKYLNQPGICLSKYGDPGYGELVKRDKYSGRGRFRDELVGKSKDALMRTVSENGITCVCCVPSLRSDIVRDFSVRLAAALGIGYADLLCKSPAQPQKNMENSAHQCRNAFDSFYTAPSAKFSEKVLLVDDIVDSRWTLTVCGYKLMEAGVSEVYPFALADSSLRGG